MSYSKQKLYLARLRKKGKTFEIILEPKKIEEVIDFKEGRKKEIDIARVLYVDEIFLDARRANRASEDLLKKVFGTTDIYKIAERIIKEGEVEIPLEYRKKELEEKYKRLISLLAQYARDPRTNLPIPYQRIENAIEKAKINIRENVPIEFQLKKVLEKLTPIIPIKINKKVYRIIIPAKYTYTLMNYVREYSTILKERWLEDGSWFVEVEIFEPQEAAFINYLSKQTNGEVEIKEV